MAVGTYFHLYTDRARRALFFVNWPGTAFARREIKSTGLLFGVLHEGKDLLSLRKIGKAKYRSLEAVCWAARSEATIPSGVFAPFDEELTTILYRAAQEMLNRRHAQLDLEHLLLALLYVPSPARDILNKHGLSYEQESRRVPFHPRKEPTRGDDLDYT